MLQGRCRKWHQEIHSGDEFTELHSYMGSGENVFSDSRCWLKERNFFYFISGNGKSFRRFLEKKKVFNVFSNAGKSYELCSPQIGLSQHHAVNISFSFIMKGQT